MRKIIGFIGFVAICICFNVKEAKAKYRSPLRRAFIEVGQLYYEQKEFIDERTAFYRKYFSYIIISHPKHGSFLRGVVPYVVRVYNPKNPKKQRFGLIVIYFGIYCAWKVDALHNYI